jgi:hypothetical protein
VTRRPRDLNDYDALSLEQQPGESFQEWQRRLRDNPIWLRQQADTLINARRRVWCLERGAAIEAGETQPYSPSDEYGVRAA